MKRDWSFTLSGAALLALAGCGGENGAAGDAQPAEASSAPAVVAEPVGAEAAQIARARPASFAQCVTCHADTPGQPAGMGPNLVGVFGKQAGSKEGYAYSTALTDSGLVWDAATLDAFIASPQRVVSGTKMAFGGVSDEAKRTEIVEYIAQLQ